MALRVQLINNIVGSITLDVADPIDINSVPLNVKRAKDSEGVFYEIILDFEFIGAGRKHLKNCYETAGGIDAVVDVNIYQYNPNNRILPWSIYYTGRVNMQRYEEDEEKLVVNIEQTGMEMRVRNMEEIDVDMQTPVTENGTPIPASPFIEPVWHSKVLNKVSDASPSTAVTEFNQFALAEFTIGDDFPIGRDQYCDFMYYGQIDNSLRKVDDLKDVYTTPIGWAVLIDIYRQAFRNNGIDSIGYDGEFNRQIRKDERNPMYVSKDTGVMSVDVVLKFNALIQANNTGGDIDVDGADGPLGYTEVKAWFEKRNTNDETIELEEIGVWEMPGHGSNIRESTMLQREFSGIYNTLVGDKFYVFITFRVFDTYIGPVTPDGNGSISHTFTMDIDPSVTRILFSNKTFTENTNIKSILIYEAFEKCIQYYSNQLDCFKSTLLGRTDRGYDVDGEGSMIVLTNGNFLRAIDDRILFFNLKDLFDFVNAVYCVGFGFETVNGVQRFVLEKKSYFYRKDVRMISLGSVYKPKKKLIPELYYNMVEFGYNTQVDIKQTDGIDEYNTLRRSTIPIINTKNKLPISTEMITSGFIIEYQKRLALVGTSEDSKYDDKNFAAVVIRDEESDFGYRTKRIEGYAEIINVLDADSGYNYDIAPQRCLLNWAPWLSSGLIRSFNKVIRFQYGTVNYFMATRKTTESELVYENGNIDTTNIEPIFDNELYIIDDTKFTKNQVDLIRQNRYGYVEFQDQFGAVFEGFIFYETGVEINAEEKKASLHLLKVFRKVL